MRADNLPSPGAVNGAQRLRVEAARAISYHEIQNDRRGAPSADAEDLRDFFLSCANAVTDSAAAAV